MKSWTMAFTTDELNVILQGLGELPAKTSIDVIKKIQAIGQTTTPKKLEGLELTSDDV